MKVIARVGKVDGENIVNAKSALVERLCESRTLAFAKYVEPISESQRTHTMVTHSLRAVRNMRQRLVWLTANAMSPLSEQATRKQRTSLIINISYMFSVPQVFKNRFLITQRVLQFLTSEA